MRKSMPVVVFASDEKFIPGLFVALYSISVNSLAEKIKIFIIDGGISLKNKKIIQSFFANSNLSIEIIDIDRALFDNFLISKRINSVSYYRLEIPQLLSPAIEKAIYLDCDIVVEGDICDLWDTKLGEKFLLAVPEMDPDSLYVSSPNGLALYKELQIPSKQLYFNAGVLLLNLSLWRQNSISSKIYKYLIEYKKFVRYHDQDGMNAILWNNWGTLPPEWNVMSSVYSQVTNIEIGLSENEFYKAFTDPKIIHYYDAEKPWHKDCLHQKKDRYFYYLETSGVDLNIN